MKEINNIGEAIKVFNGYNIEQYKVIPEEAPHSFKGCIPDDMGFTSCWLLYNNVIFNNINKIIYFIAELRIWNEIINDYKIDKDTLNDIVCCLIDPIREQCIDLPLMLCNNLQKSLIILEEIHDGDLNALETSLKNEKEWRMNQWIVKWNKYNFSNKKEAEDFSNLLKKIYKGPLSCLHGNKQHGILSHYSVDLPEVSVTMDKGAKALIYEIKKKANINDEINMFIDMMKLISRCYAEWFNYIDSNLNECIYTHFTKLSGLSGSAK